SELYRRSTPSISTSTREGIGVFSILVTAAPLKAPPIRLRSSSYWSAANTGAASRVAIRAGVKSRVKRIFNSVSGLIVRVRVGRVGSAARVVAGVHVMQALARYMRVNLGGRQVRVAQQQLHHPQISAVVEQMGGKGMAQCMGRQGLLHPCDDGHLLEAVPEGLARHHLAALAGEQHITLRFAEQYRARLAQVALQPFQRFLAERHEPFLVALADDAHQALAGV